MIDALSEIVLSVAVIVFLTTILDMMLPSSTMRPFIKMVMGLFVIVTVLSPIVAVFDQDNFIISWDLSRQEGNQLDVIMAQGQSIGGMDSVSNQEKLAEKVSKQVEGIINLMPEVKGSKVSVSFTEEENKLGSYGEVEEINVWLDLNNEGGIDIEPVVIQIGEQEQRERSAGPINDEEQKIVAKVQQVISSYYGLNQKSIKVYIAEGDE